MSIMTKEQAVRAISEHIQLTLSDVAKVKNAYDQIDIDSLRKAAQARVEVKDWKPGDRASTGVLYEDVHPELKNGAKAYYVYIDGKLALFQYIDLSGKQMLTDDDLSAAKAAHKDKIVDNLVNAQIPDEILKLV